MRMASNERSCSGRSQSKSKAVRSTSPLKCSIVSRDPRLGNKSEKIEKMAKIEHESKTSGNTENNGLIGLNA